MFTTQLRAHTDATSCERRHLLTRCVDRKGKGGRVAAAEQALTKAHLELLDATYQTCLAALDVEDSVRQQAASLEAVAPALAAVRQSIGAAQAALDA